MAPILAWSLAPAAAAEPGDDPGDDPEAEDVEDEREWELLLNEVLGATVVYPQEQGEIQLTLAPAYAHGRGRHLAHVTYATEIGVTDWLQFELEWMAPTVAAGRGSPTAVGIGDVELGGQLTWMRMRGSPWSGALALETTLPVGREDSDFSEGTVVYEPYVTLAVDPPSGRAQVFTNLGLELSSEALQPFVNAGVIGAAGITRPYLVVAYSGSEAHAVPGVSLILPAGWELIMGIPVGLTRSSDSIGVGLVLIYEINPLERRGR